MARLRRAAARWPPRRPGRDALRLPRAATSDPVRRAGAADASPRPSTRFAGIDLLATVAADGRRPTGTRSRPRRGRPASASPPDDTWSDIFSRVLVERVEPQSRPSAAPPSSTSTRSPRRRWPGRRAHDPRVAERFELYACGVELANGFGELTDPAEQRRRFEAEMAREGAGLRRALPARRGFPRGARRMMPEASGVALGFDRLVMLATAPAGSSR